MAKSIFPGVPRLLAFAKERHAIYHRRFVKKLPSPWTNDPIFQRYRFCNIFRELDTVTIWICKNIREPYAQHLNLWFMLCIARQINWPDTLADLIADLHGAWPIDVWSPKKARQIMLARKERGEKCYTGAYLIRGAAADVNTHRDKPYYTTHTVLSPLWRKREQVVSKINMGTLKQAAETLSTFYGWGQFLAAQVVADLKYTRYLERASDWWDWAALGPGSLRGLNRVLNRPIKQSFSGAEAIDHLTTIRDYIKNNSALPRLCLQDTQNALCEFDKYERVRLGEGRPRALFTSGN